MNGKKMADEIAYMLRLGWKIAIQSGADASTIDMESFFRERANNIAQVYADRTDEECETCEGEGVVFMPGDENNEPCPDCRLAQHGDEPE